MKHHRSLSAVMSQWNPSGWKRVFLAVMCLVLTASGKMPPDSMQSAIDRYSRQWNSYIAQNDLGRLMESTVSAFNEAVRQDNASLATYSGLHASQAFLFSGKLDSAIYFLDRIDSSLISEYDFLNVIYHNIAGVYAMKMELNYSSSLEHFSNALSISRRSMDRNNILAQLCNIATLYYEIEDTTGLRYAEEACRLASDIRNPYLTSSAYATMGQLSLLAGHAAEAENYVAEARREVEKGSIFSLEPLLDGLSADIFMHKGETDSAGKMFERAYSGIENTYSEAQIRILLDYGDFLKERRRFAEAERLLRQALEISDIEQNNMYRIEILSELSDLLFAAGNREEAAYVYNKLHNFSDSISIKQKERLFRKEELMREREAHQAELQQKDESIHSSKKTIWFLCVAGLLFLATSAAVYMTVRKRYSHYRQISVSVLKLSRMSSGNHDGGNKTDGEAEGHERLMEIFRGISGLMADRKFYHDKDISIVKVAQMLNTNKSYVSKAINMYAHTSFSNYVNQFRIQEAVIILSDMNSDVLMKELSERLGFNSLSTFYRVFQKEMGCSPLSFRDNVRHIVEDIPKK